MTNILYVVIIVDGITFFFRSCKTTRSNHTDCVPVSFLKEFDFNEIKKEKNAQNKIDRGFKMQFTYTCN